MAVLSNTDRQALWAKFMSDESGRGNSIDTNKPDLRAAVDAIDNWIDSNITSFNNAIPEPAKTNLTAKQKYELFKIIADRRWEVA